MLAYPLCGYGSDQWKLFEHRYKYDKKEVIDADKFIRKEHHWEAYKGEKLVGYVFLSLHLTRNLVGYAGKHMETLIAMDRSGNLTGVKLLFHSEPIVLIGLKEKHYIDFMKQYRGKSIMKPLNIGKEISMDAVTGATITAQIQNAIITGSARKVAVESGMVKARKQKRREISEKFSPLTWDELLKSGAVKSIVVNTKDLGIKGDDPYLTVYFGIATPPAIGRNVLGDKAYKGLMDSLKAGESALFVFGSGKGSFKGKAFARGGFFDRFSLEQGSKTNLFSEKDYRILTEIKAKGAPAIKEGGLFVIRDKEIYATGELDFNLVVYYRIDFETKFKSLIEKYTLPDQFLK